MKTTMVWNVPALTGPLLHGAHVGTQPLHQVVDGLDVMWWMGDRVAAGVGHYDCYIVNLFPDMEHVTQIRARQPDALIVALPDAYMDEVFLNRDPEKEQRYIQQLKAADVIGYVSDSNQQFYSVFGKPMVKIPIVIGTPNFFAAVRELPKEDYIITCDHSPRIVDYSIPNVAALAMIQKQTGLRVVYCNPAPHTPMYAAELGLKAEFQPYTVYENFVRLAAKARLGVDLYARHGYGRNELTLAYAGTPCIGSSYTQHPGPKFDPWRYREAVFWAASLLAEGTDNLREQGIQYAEQNNGFEAVREAWPCVMEAIERWRFRH